MSRDAEVALAILTDPVAIVTGSTHGVGRSTVRPCCRVGVDGVISSEDADAVAQAPTEPCATGHHLIADVGTTITDGS